MGTATPSDLTELLKRLEQATLKLERLAGSAAGASSGPVLAGPCGTAGGGAGSCAFVAAYEAIVEAAREFEQLGRQIGGAVQTQSGHVLEGAEAQWGFLKAAAALGRKAEGEELRGMFGATQRAVEAAVRVKETAGRGDRQFQHLATVAEGIGFLGWPLMAPKPAPFVGEMKDAAQFWANRVLRDCKDSDRTSVEWVSKYVALIGQVGEYVRKYHTTGVSFPAASGGGGGGAAAATVAVAAAASTSSSGGCRADSASNAGTAAAPAGKSGIFGELNRGDAVTAGLRKVERSQMTHKNPELRASGVVKAAAGAAAPPSASSGAAPSPAGPRAKGPARVALEGSKWLVENQSGTGGETALVVLDRVELKQSVYVYNCTNCAVQIKGKVNAVTMDACRRSGMVLESVVACVDVVNCSAVQVQVLGKTPTVSVDKTDGMQLFLSKECLDVEILTSKSSEMNVSIPASAAGGEEFVECAVPEQFKTKIVGTGLATAAVEHKA